MGFMIKSKVVFTEEIDDLETAVEELCEQVGDFTLQKNSVGIIFMDEDTEYGELYPMLKEKWDIPFVACTALALLTGDEGLKKSGISLMLMSADDCNFAVGMAEDLSIDDYSWKIKDVYSQSEKQLAPEEIKLVLTMGGKAPGMVGDDVIDVIDSFGKNIPIYGLFASDAFNFSKYRVFCNERSGQNAQAFVFVSGNVNPRFLQVKSISGKANFSYEVTKSNENQVFRLGNGTFVEALEKANMISQKNNVIADYIMTPFITTIKKPSGRVVESMRNLTFLNFVNGSGMFLGGIPEGASLEVGYINSEQVQKTIDEAYETICGWIGEDGSTDHTMLVISCAARYMSLGKNVTIEAETFKKKLPGNVSVMGMYSYGEFCPIGEGAEMDNTFHNSTFTVLFL